MTVTEGAGTSGCCDGCGEDASFAAQAVVNAARAATSNAIRNFARIWPPEFPEWQDIGLACDAASLLVRQHDRYLDLAARAQDLQRHLVAAAANPKIHA